MLTKRRRVALIAAIGTLPVATTSFASIGSAPAEKSAPAASASPSTAPAAPRPSTPESLAPRPTLAVANHNRLEQWATTYLLNTIFVYEHMLTQRQAAKPGSSAAQASRDDTGVRAAFAQAAMTRLQQSHPPALALRSIGAPTAAAPLSIAGKELPKDAFTPLHLAATAQLISMSFDDATGQDCWRAIAPSYALAMTELNLSCVPAPSPAADTHTPNTAMLAMVSCTLATALKESSVEAGFPPVPTSIAGLPEPSRALLRASWHIMASDYSSALQQLWSLLADYPAYRLPYTRVQRLYSMQEKGSGRVALQNL